MFASYDISALLKKVKIGGGVDNPPKPIFYACPNCGTHYNLAMERDACSKQPGCPQYEEIEAIITPDDDEEPSRDNPVVDNTITDADEENGEVQGSTTTGNDLENPDFTPPVEEVPEDEIEF